MVLTEGEIPQGKETRKDEGLIEAKKKAKEAKERLRKAQQEQGSTVISSHSSSSSSPQANHGAQETHHDMSEDDGNEDEASSPKGSDDEKDDEDNPEGDHNETDQRTLISSGPFRWTPTVIKEFMSEYRHLEGKLLLHPRTGRLYEVGTVFFYDKFKIAAAYIRTMDGGQADPLDEHPHRIDGKGGLAELVQTFDTSGGSSGSSRTPWPSSDSEWLEEQKRDPQWQEVIEDMEQEYKSQLTNMQQPSSSSSPNSSSSSSMLRNEDPTPNAVTPIERKHKGAHLVFNGVLMVKQPTYDQEIHRMLYVVPESLKRNVVELYHDSKGHPGAARTKETIHLNYWWKGMLVTVTEHVNSCKACARRKARNAVAAAPIQGYDIPRMPWDRVHMDLTGPLTESKQGNKYILVIKDALTRYVEAVPIKNKSAEEVVNAFITVIIYRHGAVGWLISDNGREFVNKLFTQVAQLLNIKHTTITAYNPRANGLAENHMRTMKDALSIYCDETQKDWDTHLGGVTMSYNTTVNSQTGFTPYFML